MIPQLIYDKGESGYLVGYTLVLVAYILDA